MPLRLSGWGRHLGMILTAGYIQAFLGIKIICKKVSALMDDSHCISKYIVAGDFALRSGTLVAVYRDRIQAPTCCWNKNKQVLSSTALWPSHVYDVFVIIGEIHYTGCSSLHPSTSPPPRIGTSPPPKKAHLHPLKSTTPPPKMTHFPPNEIFSKAKKRQNRKWKWKCLQLRFMWRIWWWPT